MHAFLIGFVFILVLYAIAAPPSKSRAEKNREAHVKAPAGSIPPRLDDFPEGRPGMGIAVLPGLMIAFFFLVCAVGALIVWALI